MFASIADEVQAAVREVWGTAEARVVTRRGAGGDGTVHIDDIAERVALDVLDAVHAGGRDFDLISEEVGERRYGAGGDVIILDPIDGSLNAKMGIPYFSITMAASTNRTYGGLYEGMVRNLITGDHWEAARGAGATLNGAPARPGDPMEGERFRVIQVEPTRLAQTMPNYVALLRRTDKVRMLGSAALNIALVASGSIGLSIAPSLRSVDCAGAMVVLKEAGGDAADLAGLSLDGLDLGLEGRVSLAAAASPAALDLALELMGAKRTTGSAPHA